MRNPSQYSQFADDFQFAEFHAILRGVFVKIIHNLPYCAVAIQ